MEVLISGIDIFVDYARRIGTKNVSERPLLVRLTTISEKEEIMKAKGKLKGII